MWLASRILIDPEPWYGYYLVQRLATLTVGGLIALVGFVLVISGYAGTRKRNKNIINFI